MSIETGSASSRIRQVDRCYRWRGVSSALIAAAVKAAKDAMRHNLKGAASGHKRPPRDCIAIAANLSALYGGAAIWAYVKPVFGLAQRALFAAWFGWCAVVGLLLFKGNNKQSFSSSAFCAF
jgi:GNAT superfamily N-acetyltransferase